MVQPPTSALAPAPNSPPPPPVAKLFDWISDQRQKESLHALVAAPMDCILKRQGSFGAFSTDCKVCFSNNAAERSLRLATHGRKA